MKLTQYYSDPSFLVETLLCKTLFFILPFFHSFILNALSFFLLLYVLHSSSTSSFFFTFCPLLPLPSFSSTSRSAFFFDFFLSSSSSFASPFFPSFHFFLLFLLLAPYLFNYPFFLLTNNLDNSKGTHIFI